jgi:hypothetical protein
MWKLRIEVGSPAFLAVVGLILAVSIAAGIGTLTLRGPFPVTALAALPLLWLAHSSVAPSILGAVVMIAALYITWLRPSLRGQAQFTMSTWYGFGSLIALSAAYYWGGWSYAVQYRGRGHTLGLLVGGMLLCLSVAILGVAGRKHDSDNIALFGRWLTLVWLITYAFPLMGEVHP